MSIKGREHIENNYSFENYKKGRVSLMDDVIERHGSWENRKVYKRWHLMEVA